MEEFRERVALVDFPSGNQITFGQARDLARFYLCTPSMVMVGEVEEELWFSQNLEAFDFVGRQVADVQGKEEWVRHNTQAGICIYAKQPSPCPKLLQTSCIPHSQRFAKHKQLSAIQSMQNPWHRPSPSYISLSLISLQKAYCGGHYISVQSWNGLILCELIQSGLVKRTIGSHLRVGGESGWVHHQFLFPWFLHIWSLLL